VKVAFHIVQGRRERLAQLLRDNGYLPVGELCTRLGISEATARRDLAALEADKAILRTRGGALMDYDQRFASFRDRQQANREGKARIARAALELIRPGTTCFLDSGTTIHALAEAIVASAVRPLTVVTNNLPVAEALSAAEGIDVELIGGRYASRQRTLLGPRAVRSLKLWRFDAAFLGAEGMDEAGLWNSHAEVVAFQRAVSRMTPRAAFCVDASKSGKRAPEFLMPWTEVDRLVTDASAAQLRAGGVSALKRQVLAA
jgi:DeoR/GlpR family transcriptional regulator of sugar metabolism